MKVLFATLAMALAISSASADVAICQEGVQILLDYLATDTEVEAEMVLLENTICPEEADPAGCKTGIRTWWPEIVKAIHASENIPTIACETLQADDCSGEWGCDSCQCRLQTIADVANDDTVVGLLLAYLKGEAFCDTTVDDATCESYIDAFGGRAIKIMANTLSEGTSRFCAEAYNLPCESV